MILTFIFLINITFSLYLCLSLLYCYVSKCLYFQKSVLCDFYLPTSVELISICTRLFECLLNIYVQEFRSIYDT